MQKTRLSVVLLAVLSGASAVRYDDSAKPEGAADCRLWESLPLKYAGRCDII